MLLRSHARPGFVPQSIRNDGFFTFFRAAFTGYMGVQHPRKARRIKQVEKAVDIQLL